MQGKISALLGFVAENSGGVSFSQHKKTHQDEMRDGLFFVERSH